MYNRSSFRDIGFTRFRAFYIFSTFLPTLLSLQLDCGLREILIAIFGHRQMQNFIFVIAETKRPELPCLKRQHAIASHVIDS